MPFLLAIACNHSPIHTHHFLSVLVRLSDQVPSNPAFYFQATFDHSGHDPALYLVFAFLPHPRRISFRDFSLTIIVRSDQVSLSLPRWQGKSLSMYMST